MSELIRVNFDSDRPTVNGRDLHAALDIKTAYKDWFPRMCEYGFKEGTDFSSFLSESSGGRPATDHQVSISMAKELCMIQRSEVGRKFRQYFIKVEESWNSPDAVMARALQFANNQISLVKRQNQELFEIVAIQEQQIAEMQPKASYYDLILQNANTVPITQIAKDYGMSGRKFNELLHDLDIQYKLRKTWILYQHYAERGYTQSRTYAVNDNRSVMHTYWTQKGRLFLYDLLKNEGIYPLIEQEA